MLPKWKAWNSMKQKPGEAKRFAIFSNRTAVGLWVTLKVFELFWRPQTKASIQSVQSLSCVRLFATPWTAALQASLSITNSQSLLKSCPSSQWYYPTISASVVPFSSCLQSFPASGSFPMSQFFASGGHKYWSFSFSISPSSEYSGLISFRIDWFGLIAIQGTLKSFLML